MSVFYTGWVLEGVPREQRCEAKSSRTKNSKVTRDFRQVQAAICVIPYVLYCFLYCSVVDSYFGGVPVSPYISGGQSYKGNPNKSRSFVQIQFNYPILTEIFKSCTQAGPRS